MKSMFSQFFASLISGIVFLGVLGGGFGVFEVAADECCTEAGYADECWWESAEDDGVTCTTSSGCDLTCDKTVTDPSNSNVGLCACTSDADCVSGVCNLTDNRCGPSWCNGYLICSCFGGCINAELGTYASPEAMCSDTTSGYPGTCCEGTFPDGIGGVGYCSDDPTCNGGCTADADCNDGNPCTQDECIANGCVNTNLDGNINDTDVFGNPIGAACPFDTSIYDIECALPACDNGACSVDTGFNNGGSCDADGNECTYGICGIDTGVCNQYALTDVSTPSFNDVGFVDCCNDDPDPSIVIDDFTDYPLSYNDGGDCKTYYCDATLHDAEFNAVENSECASHPWASDTDPCSSWACGGGAEAGTCVYTTDVYLDDPCWDPAAMAVANSTYPTPPDPCVPAYCDGFGGCIPDHVAGWDCTPASVSCELWTCQNSNATYPTTLFCTWLSSASPSPDLEICHDPMMAAQELGIIGPGMVTRSDTNECADDDYGAVTTGRFIACAGYVGSPNGADYVYDFEVSVNTSQYTLQHVAADLSRVGTDWDPYLYVRENCENGTATSGDQMTCNNDRNWTGTNYSGTFAGTDGTTASVTAGPWPLRDLTDYNDSFGADDGIETENDWHAQLIVDTWSNASAIPPETAGGDFVLGAIKETHYNSDCRSSASYIAAPIMNNFTSWKERWLGSTTGYPGNPTSDDTSCTSSTAASAYFRVEVENITQPDWDEGSLQWESVDWESKYKVSVDPALDSSHLNVALTMWNGSVGETDCGFTSGTTHSCGGVSGELQEHIIADGTSDFYKWLEVSNQQAGQTGDYELQMIKVPREFFGFQEAFVGANSGCNSSGSPDTWYLGGMQLDFVPTNSRLNGYMVKEDNSPSLTAAGWLVNPSNQVCRGIQCTTGTGAGQIRSFPFDFPFSGRFFDRYRVDASGRIDIGSGNPTDPYYLNNFVYEDVGNSERSNSNSKFLRDSRFNPMLAPMWGKIIPCMCSETREEGGGWFADPYILWDDACYGSDGDTDARIYVDNAQWDGSTVTVITWDGFDGYQEPNEAICTNTDFWGDCTNWACDYHYSSTADRANFLQFQVIIRQDGRFTFFYKSTNGVTQPILSYNGWSVGVSGTWHSNQRCDDGFGTSPDPTYTPDDWCDVVLGEVAGMSGTYCDNETEIVNGVTIYDAGYWCVNKINNLHSGLSGSWQTGE